MSTIASSNELDEIYKSWPAVRCEQIICVVVPGEDEQWWQALLQENRPLFTGDDSTRLLSIDLDAVVDVVNKAIHEGYKPLVFCSDQDIKHVVQQALSLSGHHAISVLSHDVDAECMSYLFHHPSYDVLDALAGKGRLRSPKKGYRQLLETWLETDELAKKDRQLRYNDVKDHVLNLEDFRLDHTDFNESEDEYHVALFWRWAAMKTLNLRFNKKYSTVALTTPTDALFPNPLILRFRTDRFDFIPTPFNKQECDITHQPETIEAIARLFNLPSDYQNWNSEDAIHSKAIIKKIEKGRSILQTILTVEQFAFLRKQYLGLPSLTQAIEAILGAFTPQEPLAVRGSRIHTNPLHQEAQEKAHANVEIMLLKGEGLLFGVWWPADLQLGDNLPDVMINLNQQPAAINYEWMDDCRDQYSILKLNIEASDLSIVPCNAYWNDGNQLVVELTQATL